MLRKRKISYRYSAHRIRRAETAAREDPVREMDRTHSQDRPAGGRNGQRPASGQNGSRQDRPARGPQANGERENRRPQEGRLAGNRRPEEGQRGGFRQNRPADGRNGQRPSSAPNGQRGNRRQDEGAKNGQRPDSRRNDRNDRNDRNSIPSPLVEQQKPQRNKAKDKEKDYKKKENREEGFESKGKKGRKQKPTVEVQRPQPKPEVKKEEEIKQITIPEVLTIQELADKMKVVPSVIVKKLFMQGKIVTVNQEIDFETAEEIAMEFEILCEKEEVVDVIEELLKEDEEDEGVDLPRAPFVGGDERTDQKHRRARRAHEIREHGAEPQKDRVDDRTAHETPAHVNAARHRKERAHEDEEGQIVGEENVDHLVKGGGGAEGDPERNGAGRSPEERDLSEMMVPEARKEKGKERDGEKNAGKRNGPGKTELGTVHAFGSEGETRQKKKRTQGRPTQSRKRHDETPREERRPSKVEG